MSVDNWKLWLVPFTAWGLAMAWYSGYQSGYQEGHATAWQMSRPNLMSPEGKVILSEQELDSAAYLAKK